MRRSIIANRLILCLTINKLDWVELHLAHNKPAAEIAVTAPTVSIADHTRDAGKKGPG